MTRIMKKCVLNVIKFTTNTKTTIGHVEFIEEIIVDNFGGAVANTVQML